MIKNEISVHRELRFCENALKLYKVYECEKKIYLLLEY